METMHQGTEMSGPDTVGSAGTEAAPLTSAATHGKVQPLLRKRNLSAWCSRSQHPPLQACCQTMCNSGQVRTQAVCIGLVHLLCFNRLSHLGCLPPEPDAGDHHQRCTLLLMLFVLLGRPGHHVVGHILWCTHHRAQCELYSSTHPGSTVPGGHWGGDIKAAACSWHATR
jgi:hypothetical protein